MHEVTSDPDILKGSVFHRLFQRAFPGHFKYDSIHLWQPFYTPAMNLVLANQQNYLSSLDLSGLNLHKELNLPSNDVSSLKALIAEKGYEAVRGKVRRSPAADASAKGISEPAPLIEISNLSDIKDKILGANKAEFRNPATLDGNLIEGKYLRDMMTGESERFDKAAAGFEKLVTPETEKMIHEYFVGVSKEILRRERRKFQRQPLYQFSFDDARKDLQSLKLPNEVLKKELQGLDNLEERVKTEKKAGKKTFIEFSEPLKKDLTQILQVYQVDVVRE